MYSLILQLILFSSLGIILYLMARALPRLDERKEVVHASGWFDRMLTRLPLAKVDAGVNSFLEKMLRKMKVIVLKVDNALNQYLNRVRRGNAKKAMAPEEKPQLFPLLTETKEEEKKE